jgi:hypothetical protein
LRPPKTGGVGANPMKSPCRKISFPWLDFGLFSLILRILPRLYDNTHLCTLLDRYEEINYITLYYIALHTISFLVSVDY